MLTIRNAILSAIFASALGLFWSAPAMAQVNVETLRKDPYKPGFGAALEGSLSLSRGNINLMDVGGSASMQYQTLFSDSLGPDGKPDPEVPPFIRQRAFLNATAHFTDSAGQALVNQKYLHARWTQMFTHRVGLDFFTQHQADEFFRLQQRSLVGAGVRLELVHTNPFTLALGTDYMLEYERITVAPDASDAPTSLNHRWSNFLAARLQLWGDQVLAQNTIYVQPRFDLFSDVRVLEELQLQTKVTDRLYFGIDLLILYDSMPPTGVKTTDLRLSNTLKYVF